LSIDVSDIAEYSEGRGFHIPVTGGMGTLNNVLGGVYVAGGFTPK
jgi:hypothetical protein